MGAISRWLDRFCYKHPRLGIPGLMKYIVIANVAVYLRDMFSNGYFSAKRAASTQASHFTFRGRIP